jgi:hypothetical protein
VGNTVVVDSTVLVETTGDVVALGPGDVVALRPGDVVTRGRREGAVELATEVTWRTGDTDLTDLDTDLTDAAAGMATAVEVVLEAAAGKIVTVLDVIRGVLGVAAASFWAFGPPICLTVTALAGLDHRVNAASCPSEGELPKLVPLADCVTTGGRTLTRTDFVGLLPKRGATPPADVGPAKKVVRVVAGLHEA